MAGKAGVRFDAQPLLDAVEARGGVTECPGFPGMKIPGDEEGVIAERICTPEERAAGRRYVNAVSKGRFTGFFTIGVMDDLCVNLLQVHPMAVYGDAYLSDDWTMPEPEQVAA